MDFVFLIILRCLDPPIPFMRLVTLPDVAIVQHPRSNDRRNRPEKAEVWSIDLIKAGGV